MAIDSVSKRFSIMDFGGASWAIPIPDGTFDQGDRQHFLQSYSGILWEAVIALVLPLSAILTESIISGSLSESEVTGALTESIITGVLS